MDSPFEFLNNSNMTKARRALPESAVPAPGLPTYALYGERDRTHATDWLHCEAIADRSRRHDWEIRPHRHEVLFQFLYIARGQAEATLEQHRLPLAGPCVLWVPPLVPHGFRFAPDIHGHVLTVLDQHLARLLQPAPALRERLASPRHLAWAEGDEQAAGLGAAMDRLVTEFHASQAWRDLALDAALLHWVLALGRLAPAAPAADEAATATAGAGTAEAGSRAIAHVQRYRALVDARFREQPSLTSLAAEIGITTTQLNRCCHQVLGHAALGVLQGRLLLEAQRDLAYTTMSIKQVALGLGFADAGYFSRFFRQHLGHTPQAWRLRSAQAR